MENDLKTIYEAAILSVNPYEAVKKHLIRDDSTLTLLAETDALHFHLDEYDSLYIVGAGKATSPMAQAVEDICGHYITEGAISVKYGYTADLKKIEVLEAAHPIPDKAGRENAEKIVNLLEQATEKDLVICLISGGGSALLPLPPEGITLEQKGETTNLLLKSGASIHEINSVRKHLSQVKGGHLAKKAFPATVINLMISDVVGDNMDVIASGPFVADNSTFQDAVDTLKKYKIYDRVPEEVRNHLDHGTEGRGDETPEKDSPIFKNVANLIVSSNIIACKSAAAAAQNHGYNTLILSSLIEGDTAASAHFHSAIAREILLSGNPIKKPACIISGGETTVEVTGEGLGGRNMEFAMQSIKEIENLPVLAASIGTDGTDGPTDAAGAYADGDTMKKSLQLNLDLKEYMKNNDSYHFFDKVGNLIKTGPTNTNVMDIRIVLIK
jgi:glycerate 2-kinase